MGSAERLSSPFPAWFAPPGARRRAGPLGEWARSFLRIAALTHLYLVAWVVATVAISAVFGMRPILVATGSMAPTVRPGDLLLVGGRDAADPIETGSIVTFRAPDDPAVLRTHRVVGTDDDGSIVTKGDANLAVDTDSVTRSDIIGVSRWMLPVVGRPVLWLRSGDLVPFAAWLALTLGTLAALSHSRGRRWSPARSAPAEVWRSWTSTQRRAVGVLGVALTAEAVLAVAVVAIAPTSAAFAASTTNAGSSLTAMEWDALGSLTGGLEKSTCTAKADGSAWCWGLNDRGQLGDGSTTDRSSPVQVVGVGGTGTLASVAQIVGGNKTTCARTTAGAVYCWGENNEGEVGDGTTTTPRATPLQVLGPGGVGALSGIVHLVRGGEHFCGVTGAGAVYCWGRNDVGQIGDGTTTNRPTPVQVVGVGGVGTLAGVTVADGGDKQTCARTTAGAVYCWGQNNRGQVGDGTTTNRPTPVQVVGLGGTGTLANVASVVGGLEHQCALRTDGSVACWGTGANGANGDGSTANNLVPELVLGVGGVGTLAGVTDLAHGERHVCAVAGASGGVVCWGHNNQGQVGDNTTTDRTNPVAVVGVGGVGTLIDAVKAGAGKEHGCAARVDRSVVCWGRNDRGQIGDGTSTDRPTPTVAALP